jgi:hypothetical protein
MISYINHPEESQYKAHTDILLNGEYIGYYITERKVLTAFIEIHGEMNSGEFKNTKQLETTIQNIINN